MREAYEPTWRLQPMTRSLGFFGTGRLSPVSKDSSKAVLGESRTSPVTDAHLAHLSDVHFTCCFHHEYGENSVLWSVTPWSIPHLTVVLYG